MINGLKQTCCVTLLRQLASSGWGAGAKILHIAALSLVYSTAEYCAPFWCRSVHTRLIYTVLNDALHIVFGCTPPDNLAILSGIQPAGIRRLGTTILLANRSILEPDYLLLDYLVWPLDARQKRLKFRRSFVPTARKLLNDVSEQDVRVGQWTVFI